MSKYAKKLLRVSTNKSHAKMDTPLLDPASDRRHVRMIKTIAQFSSFLTVGMSLMIVGPTLLDMREQVDTSLTLISFTLTSRSVGYVIGSVIMGVLFPKVNFQLASAVVLLLSAITTGILPHMRQLWSLLFVFFLNGASVALYETGGYVFILQLWERDAAPVMQALMFMFGFGGLLAPVIAEPFLVSRSIDPADNITMTTVERTTDHDVKLFYPYSILALLLLGNAVFHMINWILYPATKTRDKGLPVDGSGEFVDPCSAIPNYTFWKYTIITLVMLFMHIYYGIEITFGSFVMTFAVKSNLCMSKTSGAYLTTAFWSSFTLPKIFAIFLVKWIGNEKTIVYSLIMILIGNVILAPFGNDNPYCLWTGTIVIGIGMSSIWACMFSYLEEVLKLSSSIGSLMIVAAMVGEFVFPVIISTMIEHEPRILLWTVLFSSLAITVLFSLIVIVVV